MRKSIFLMAAVAAQLCACNNKPEVASWHFTGEKGETLTVDSDGTSTLGDSGNRTLHGKLVKSSRADGDNFTIQFLEPAQTCNFKKQMKVNNYVTDCPDLISASWDPVAR